MPKEKSPAIKKKLAKKGLSQLNRECSLDAFKHNLRREYHAGQTAQGTQHVAIALSVLKRSCGVDSKDRMTPKEIVAAGGKRESMNVESINSILVKAIGQIQEQELSEVTQHFSKNEHDEPTKNELEKNIVATIYHFTKKGFPKVGFVDIHMEARPLFGEMFTRNYKGIVTKAINRLRRRGIVKIDEHAPQVVYMLTPGGIQAAKTGNMKKVKASASTKKQNEINKTILMKFFLEYIYDNQEKNGVGQYDLENSVRESFSGEERSIMASHREEAINELVKKEYIEQKWISMSKWSSEYRWFITPKGSRARVQMKIPQF